MLHLKDEPLCKSRLRSVCALVFHCSAVILLVTKSCEGQSQVDGPSTAVALVGEDVLLPCHLESPMDALSMTLEWGRPDLKPRFVHVWHEGQDHLVNQNPSYKGRTSLSTDRLRHGDVSLKLSKVKLSDEGKYRCFIPKLNRESAVSLLVGVVSSPAIARINISSSGVVLRCESEGWYPEPEVLWLDAEGNLLSAGPTETVRGPDDLYTVSSRVTVEKRHSNSFTCRVQQKDINQTRETHIHVSALILSAEQPVVSGSAARIGITLVAVFIFILAVALIVWKWHHNKTIITMLPEDGTGHGGQTERLLSKTKKDYEETKRQNEKLVDTLQKQREELETLRDQLKVQKEKMAEELDGTEEKIRKVETETASDRAKGFWEMKKVMLENKRTVQERKQEQDHLIMKTSELLNKAGRVLSEIKKEEKDEEKTKVTGWDE